MTTDLFRNKLHNEVARTYYSHTVRDKDEYRGSTPNANTQDAMHCVRVGRAVSRPLMGTATRDVVPLLSRKSAGLGQRDIGETRK